MEIVVRGRHIDLSDQFRVHATESLSRLERHGANLIRLDVEVTKEANPRLADRAFTVQLTGNGRGPVIRAEAAAADKYAAFDTALDRMVEQLRRSADRIRALQRNGRAYQPPTVAETEAPAQAATEAGVEAAEPDVVYEQGPVIVREKTHATSPMTVEQALDAMELVGHDFYLFLDSETGKPSVVYRRRGYDYGLIRVDVTAEAATA